MSNITGSASVGCTDTAIGLLPGRNTSKWKRIGSEKLVTITEVLYTTP